MQNYSPAFTQRKNARQATPIEIIDVYINSQDSVDSQTIFLNDSNYNIDFWPYRDMNQRQTYVALGILRGASKQEMNGQLESIEVTLDNVSRTFSTLFTQYDLRGKRVVIRRIYADLLNVSGDFELLFDGIIDSPQMSLEEGVRVELRPSVQESLDYEIPKQYFQVSCNNRFTDSYCASVHGPVASGTLLQERTGMTIDSVIDQTHFVDSALGSEITGDYDPSIIKITTGNASNVGQRRTAVVSGTQIKLDHPFPATVVAGDVYSLQRDCGKEYERDCKNKFGNQLNFRGFRTLPKTLVQKG